MTDDDLDLLRAIRPDPQPDAAVTERHRRLLERTMSGDAGGSDGPITGVLASDDPYDSARRRATSPRRRWAAALVAAAVSVLGGLGVWVVGADDGSKVASGPGPAGPYAAPPPTVPACGSEIPASFEVPGALGGPTLVPAEQAEPAATPGQVVLRWTKAEGSVEVRWPAVPGADYDLDQPESKGEPSGGLSGHRLELGPGTVEGGQPEGSPSGALVVDTDGHVQPGDGCNVIDARVAGPDDVLRTGVDLGVLFEPPTGSDPRPVFVDLGALITAREEVDRPPGDPIVCGSDDTPIPNRSGDGTSEAQPQPADALRQFVASSGGDGLGDAGFTELVEADGTLTYGTPFHEGDGWVVLISVVPVDGGWIVDGWKSSGC